MKKILILIATALPFFVKAQPYAAMALGYMPQKCNTFFLSHELTVGFHIGKQWCVEYNQNISLSSRDEAPKYIQLRTGPVFSLNRELTLHTVAGYSITSVPSNTSKNIGHGVTAAVYLLQDIKEDVQIKFELSVNNGFHLVPSIGVWGTF